MKKKIIFLAILIFIVGIFVYNIGADKRALVSALKYRGYEKCADGIYRLKEFKEEKDHLIMIERSFDVKINHGESHITELFKRLDGQMVEESSIITLASWDYDRKQFDPIDYEWH